MIKVVDENTSILIVDLEYLLSSSFRNVNNNTVSIPISQSELSTKSLVMSEYDFYKYTFGLRGSYRSLFFYLHQQTNRLSYLVKDYRVLEKEDVTNIANNITLLNFSYKFLDFLHTNGIDIEKYNNISNVIKNTILIPEFSGKYLDSIIEEIVANDLISKIELINFLGERQF